MMPDAAFAIIEEDSVNFTMSRCFRAVAAEILRCRRYMPRRLRLRFKMPHAKMPLR